MNGLKRLSGFGWLRFAVVAVLVQGFAGCSGGGSNASSSTAPPDTTAPTVTLSTPTPGSTGVAVNSTISVAFSEAVNPATVTSSSFTLTGPGGAVSGSVSMGANNNTAVFTPNTALANGGSYTATVTTAVADNAGNALAAPVSISFTIVAASVSNLPPVATNDSVSGSRGRTVTTANLAANDTDPEGQALHVVDWTPGAKGSVHYEGGGVFTYEPRPYVDSGSDAFSYTVIDNVGNTSTAIASLSLPAGWGRPQVHGMISGGRLGGYTPLVNSANDDQIMAWEEGGAARISRYAAATRTWSEAVTLGAGPVQQLLIDASGRAIVFTNDAVYRFTASNSVDASQTFSGAGYLRGRVDASGNVTVVWVQYNVSTYDLYANRMDSAGTWGTAQLIESVAGNAQTPQLVIDASGNVTVVWVQADGSSHKLRTNYMTAAGVWSADQALDATSSSVNTPMLTVGANGVAAAWIGWRDGGVYLRSRRLSAGTWAANTDELLMEDTNINALTLAVLRITSAGDLLVVGNGSTSQGGDLWSSDLR